MNLWEMYRLTSCSHPHDRKHKYILLNILEVPSFTGSHRSKTVYKPVSIDIFHAHGCTMLYLFCAHQNFRLRKICNPDASKGCFPLRRGAAVRSSSTLRRRWRHLRWSEEPSQTLLGGSREAIEMVAATQHTPLPPTYGKRIMPCVSSIHMAGWWSNLWGAPIGSPERFPNWAKTIMVFGRELCQNRVCHIRQGQQTWCREVLDWLASKCFIRIWILSLARCLPMLAYLSSLCERGRSCIDREGWNSLDLRPWPVAKWDLGALP